MDKHNDKLWSGSHYENRFDEEQRVVRNLKKNKMYWRVTYGYSNRCTQM